MVPFYLIPVMLASFYSLMVTVCVAGRMDRRTKIWIRVPICLLSSLAFLAVVRTAWGEWEWGPLDIALAAAVCSGAAVLAHLPRIKT